MSLSPEQHELLSKYIDPRILEELGTNNLNLVLKEEIILRKYNGEYEPGKEPVETIHFASEVS